MKKVSICAVVFALLACTSFSAVAAENTPTVNRPGIAPTEQASRKSQLRSTGRPDTLFALGVVYEFGHGVPVDPYRAAQYYYQAAALYAARGAMNHFRTCRDAMRRLNPEHPYLKPLEELVTEHEQPA